MLYLNKVNEFRTKSEIFKLKDITDFGIPKHIVYKLLKKGDIIRISHGLYSFSNTYKDEMYILQKQNNKIIFSHNTSLFIHGFSDRDSLKYSVSVPSGYNSTHINKEKTNVYYIKKELHQMGITSKNNILGNQIVLYNIERTLCDIIRNRNDIDIEIISNAFKKYRIYKQKNIPKLIYYAKNIRVWSVIKKYLEVLL